MRRIFDFVFGRNYQPRVMQDACLDAHPCLGCHPCFAEPLDGVRMERSNKYNSNDHASTPHPGLGEWSSRCEKSDSSHRADRFAPNESSAAQTGAELWHEKCFGWMQCSILKSDSSRRADRFAPNDSSVAQIGAELWLETCFERMCIQKMSRPHPSCFWSFG